MTIDLFSGEVTREPVVVDEAFVAHCETTVLDMEDGDIRYVDAGALWIHPDNNQVWISSKYAVITQGEIESADHLYSMARLMKFKGALIADVSHTAEAARQYGEFDEFQLCTLPRTRVLGEMESSFPVDGALFIDQLDVTMFSEHWHAAYGDKPGSFLSPIEVVLADDDGDTGE